MRPKHLTAVANSGNTSTINERGPCRQYQQRRIGLRMQNSPERRVKMLTIENMRAALISRPVFLADAMNIVNVSRGAINCGNISIIRSSYLQSLVG